jgi:tight adherence protein B
MTALLAAVSAALFVGAVWEAAGALLRMPLLELLARGIGPVRGTGRDGRRPSDAESRRLRAVALLTLGAAGWLAGGLPAGLLLAAAAPVSAGALVRARERRWSRAAGRDLVPAARALADALGAGRALPHAIDTAARDGALTGAGRSLLAEASARLALGASLDDALATMARRARSPAWDSLASAVLVQRRTGGDLARLLRDLAESAERGARIEREARAASAQARLTARIVVGLPLLAFVLAEVAAPGTAASVLADPLARVMLGAALGCQVAALVAVRRIVRVGA